MANLTNKQINKILDVKLLKNKMYVLNKKIKFFNLKAAIKTNFKVAFKYQMFNKTIFFLGVAKQQNNFFFKLIKGTKHFFLLNDVWFKGALTNSEINFKYFMLEKKLTNQIKRLISIKQKVNLVLLIKSNSIKNELTKIRVPIISLSGFNKLCDYSINFFKKNLSIDLFTYFFKILKKKAKFLKRIFIK